MSRHSAVLALAFAVLLPIRAEAQSSNACADTSVTLVPQALYGASVPLVRALELGGASAPRAPFATRYSQDVRVALCVTSQAVTANLIPLPLARFSLTALPVTAVGEANSGYARGGNDGVLWAGKGVSSAISSGARLRLGIFSAALQPTVFVEQNADFRTFPVQSPGLDPFGNPWLGTIIDLPQRPGEGARTGIDAGQSYARVDTFGLALGVSNENIRWGPALRYPLMFSYNPPGFPHLFLETTRGVDIGIGRVWGNVLVGWLSQSDFFRVDSVSSRREVGAVLLGFQPRGLEGLSLGLASVFEQNVPAGGLSLSSYLRSVTQFLPTARSGANSPGNELASIYARWEFPIVGFEVYADWAHDDYAGDALDILMEPDYSQAYTLGFGKVITGSRRWFYLAGELTHLEASLPLRGGRGVNEFYTHTVVVQGHTQRGQLLGAYPGPGSDAQYLAADMLTGTGSLGIYTERIRHNEDVYYATFARYFGSQGHDVELTGGLRGSRYLGEFVVSGDLNFSRRWNRDFLDELAADPTQLHGENNLGATLALSWTPRRALWTRGRTPPGGTGAAQR